MTLHHIYNSLPSNPLQIRRGKKKTRLYLDHEYIAHGFLAALPRSATITYLVLAKYANFTTQTCFPSLDTIMKESGIKNRNTAVAATKLLAHHRVITISKRTRRSNLYTLIDPSCWVRPETRQRYPEPYGK